MVVRPPLSLDVASEVLAYDPDSGLLHWKRDRGNVTRAGDTAGSLIDQGYLVVSIKKRAFKAHRIAWLLHHGVHPHGQIDHINGVKSDNRMVNLRLASQSQNNANRILRKRSDLPKGVYFDKRRGNYRSVIRVNSVARYLGTYTTWEAAHAAYKRAATDAFGDFARCE